MRSAHQDAPTNDSNRRIPAASGASEARNRLSLSAAGGFGGRSPTHAIAGSSCDTPAKSITTCAGSARTSPCFQMMTSAIPATSREPMSGTFPFHRAAVSPHTDAGSSLCRSSFVL